VIDGKIPYLNAGFSIYFSLGLFRMDDLTVSQFVSGLVLFAIIGGTIAAIRRRSEDAAVYILGGLVVAGALWAASKSGIGGFVMGLIGFTFLAVFLWLISGIFTPHD
jgi:hypothetical protein